MSKPSFKAVAQIWIFLFSILIPHIQFQDPNRKSKSVEKTDEAPKRKVPLKILLRSWGQ